MSEQTLQLVQVIRARLAQAMRRMSLSSVAFGTIVALALAALLWTVATALEALLWLPAGLRGLLFLTVVLGSIGTFAYLAGPSLLRLLGLLPPQSSLHAAKRIGDRFPDVGDRLRNLLDLSEGRSSEAPPQLLDGAVQMLGRQLLPVSFDEIEDFSRPKRALRLSLVPLLALLLFMVAAPGSFFGASQRLGSIGADFVRPAPYAFQVEPGDVELILGAELQTSVTAEGRRLPEEVTLALNYEGEEHVERVNLLSDSSGVFRHSVVNVRRPMRYRVESAAVTTEWYEVAVLERPVMRGLQVTLTYPAYSRGGRRAIEPNVGDVTALAGTRVDVEVGLGAQQLEGAYLEFNDGSSIPLNRDGGQGVATFTLRQNGSYRITLEGENGIRNAEPIEYQLQVVDDAPPSIVMTSPSPTTELDRNLAVPVGARILDDFGFSDLKLHYRLAESRYKTPSDSFSVIDIPIQDPTQLDQHVGYGWLLAETTRLDPVPGDVVEYYLQVWDNDSWRGYKSARGETYRLTVPSLTERYRDLAEHQDSAEEEMVELLEEAESIRSDFQQLRDELRRNQEGNWDNERQLQQLQSRQAEMEQRVDQLGEQLQEMTQEMQTNDLVSSETLQMYEELQKVVEEINSPELREALERLQEAVQNLDLQQLQESLGDTEFNEQQYRQRLERTLELFKKIRVQQELDEAARRAEALAEQQRKLAERTRELMNEDEASASEDEDSRAEEERGAEDESSTSESEDQSDSESEQGNEGQEQPDGGSDQSKSQSADDLAREQERAQQDAQDLMEELRRTQEQMQELGTPSKDQLQELMEKSESQQIPQQMQQNAQQLRQQQLQDAQQGQQQMSQQLQQMSESLRQMQESMSGSSMNLNIAGIRQALEDVLTLSQNQETARQGVQQLAPDSPLLRDYAQDQVRLGEGLSIVADSLQRLSREIPQMSRTVQQYTGEALREMSAATTALADRSARAGAAHQQGAMMHLNELALVLADLLDQMMSGGGGGGSMSMQQMIDQLQNSASQQQQLNQQIQEFLNDIQGSQLVQDAEQRLQQMAQQQAAIRQQLREIARNSDARGKLLGDLNRIADQMEETIQELRTAQADRRTIERQQQILTRLLEAQKSLQERGREERREGRTADDLFRESPDALTPSEAAEKLRRDLIRALEAGYAPEYQELIKRYFELLQQQSAPQGGPETN